MAGDVIVAINGKQIDQKHSFSELLFEHHPGETITVTVNRNGKEMTFKVTLAERPANM